MIDSLDSNYPVLVYKTLNIESKYWEVFVLNEKTFDIEDHIIAPLGTIVSTFMNFIVNSADKIHPQSITECNISIYKDCFSAYKIDYIHVLSKDKLNSFIDYVNELISMSEIAKSRAKNREISYADHLALEPFFLKLKDVPFIALNYDEYPPDFIYDYLKTEGLLKVRNYDDIIKICEKETTPKGTEVQCYKIADFLALFVLDLEELLFGTMTFPKYQICNGCGELFVCKHRNNSYCVTCNTSQRQNNRKKESRADEINRLYEQIINLYRYREEKANKFADIYLKEKRKGNEAFIKTGAFKDEYLYYKKQINGKIIEVNPKYDSSINTREKLIEWLKKKKEHLIKEDTYAQDDETH